MVGWQLGGRCSLMRVTTLYRKFATYIPRKETPGPRSQFLHSCIWERFIYSHGRSYLESLISCQHERTLGSTAGAERRAGNCRQAVVGGIPCPPIQSFGWAEISHKWPTYKFPTWKITDHKWKQLILEVNFLFDLRVNEILKKTFI